MCLLAGAPLSILFIQIKLKSVKINSDDRKESLSTNSQSSFIAVPQLKLSVGIRRNTLTTLQEIEKSVEKESTFYSEK